MDESELSLYIIIGDNIMLRFFELLEKFNNKSIIVSDEDLEGLESKWHQQASKMQPKLLSQRLRD